MPKKKAKKKENMRILIINPFKNNWADNMKDYFNSRGHKCVVTNGVNVDAMAFSDVVICGWANQVAEVISKNIPKYAKYICYVRSYEIFHNFVQKVDWSVFDKVLLVNNKMREPLHKQTKGMEAKYKLDSDKIDVIPNGVNLAKFPKQNHKRGKKIGFVADLSFKKGIQLLAQILMKLPKDYELYILGDTPELRLSWYFDHILKNTKIKCYIDEKTDNVAGFLEKVDYIISTSPVEGNPNNIIEAMACGVKPIIHNWPGAEDQFPEQLIFNTVDRAVELIAEDKYESDKYRDWVEVIYDHNKVYKQLEDVCIEVLS